MVAMATSNWAKKGEMGVVARLGGMGPLIDLEKWVFFAFGGLEWSSFLGVVLTQVHFTVYLNDIGASTEQYHTRTRVEYKRA